MLADWRLGDWPACLFSVCGTDGIVEDIGFSLQQSISSDRTVLDGPQRLLPRTDCLEQVQQFSRTFLTIVEMSMLKVPAGGFRFHCLFHGFSD